LNFWEMRSKVSFNKVLGHNDMKDISLHLSNKWSHLYESALSHNLTKRLPDDSCRFLMCVMSFAIPIILVLFSMAILGILKCAFGGMPIPGLAYGLAESVCIICCTLCPLTLEFLIIDWCMEPFDDDGDDNEEAKFLWICHRKDYRSDFLAGTLEEANREELVDTRFQTLKGLCDENKEAIATVQNNLTTLRTQVTAVQEQYDKNKHAIATVQNNVTTVNTQVSDVKEQVAAVQASVNKILEVVQAGQPGTNEQVVTVQAGEDETLEVVQVWQPGKNEPAATVQASVDEISEVVQAGQPG